MYRKRLLTQSLIVRSRIDIESLCCQVPPPKILSDQKQNPVDTDEHSVHSKALPPFRRLKDWEHCDGVEAEECPANRHHGASGETARFIVVFHDHIYPREDDRCNAGGHTQ